MVKVVLITLLFGCSPALAALLAPPKALRTREEWLRIKSADDVLTALDCSDITLARTVELSDGCLRASAPVSAGEEILTWSGILSAEDAYKDMDVGLPLRKLADQCGPGFETIALSGLLGAEYLRAFRTRKPEALLEGGGAEAFTDLIESRWHELTQAIWTDEARNEYAPQMARTPETSGPQAGLLLNVCALPWTGPSTPRCSSWSTWASTSSSPSSR